MVRLMDPDGVGAPEVTNTADDEALVAQLYPTLWNFAAGYASPPRLEADDLVQEALARRLRIGRLEELDQPALYLMKSIANLARNDHRDQKVRRRHAERVAPEELAPSYPSDTDFLLALKPTTRAVLVLVDLEGYSITEAAEVVGTNPVALRARLSRARRLLRSDLTKGA